MSVERVVSGPGLVQIHKFLREESGEPEPSWLLERFRGADAAQVISETALAGEDPVCREALALFMDAYGAEAGNLALQGLTIGGMYIAGGIAPKIRQAMLAGPFMAAFVAKGRMTSLLEKIPVRLITEPLIPLWGAAVYSWRAEGRMAARD